MKILYIDESGTANNSEHDLFVLASIAVDLDKKKIIEEIVHTYLSKTRHNNVEELELHANAIMVGRGIWRQFPKPWRVDLLTDCLKELKDNRLSLHTQRTALKNASQEEIIKLFINHVKNFHQNLGESHGIVISDKMKYEKEIQSLCKGQFPKLIEPPFFTDSKTTRCLQFVDLVAYSYWRFHEKKDARFNFKHLTKSKLEN